MRVLVLVVLCVSFVIGTAQLSYGSPPQVVAPPKPLVPPPAVPPDSGTQALETAAQTTGAPLTAIVSNVSSSITVDAVLLPYKVAKRAFGKEVAKNYAVVHVTVSNRDPKQSLILHSTFLDYSQWLFNGSYSAFSKDTTVHTESYQAQNKAAQVSSAEVRTVRTELEDAQLWTLRNWVIRSAVAAGTVASGLSFASSSSYFAPSVSAYSADFVPALGVLWPDNTQSQVNLISDIGFRTNRVIPANSSDVVIAFFPLERFLTKDLRDLYYRDPAAFFNPAEMLFERKSKYTRLVLDRLGSLMGPGKNATDVGQAIIHYEKASLQVKQQAPKLSGPAANPCFQTTPPSTVQGPILGPDDCAIVDMLNRVSLNTIRLVIGGEMSIDTAAVPATISGLTLSDNNKPPTWISGETLSGTITGTFLSGGVLTITGIGPDGTALPAADFSAPVIVTANANDSTLPFTEKLGAAAIASGSKLAFVVSKKATDGSATSSTPFSYTVVLPTLNVPPTVSNDTTASTWTVGKTLAVTLTGTNLSGATVTVTGIDPSKKAIAGLTTNKVPGGASATSIPVTVKLPVAVAVGSTLTFTVKTDAGTVSSAYTVPAAK